TYLPPPTLHSTLFPYTTLFRSDLLRRIRQLEQQAHPVQIYPDAEEYIQQQLFQENIAAKVAAIRANPGAHPLRKELLKTELLPRSEEHTSELQSHLNLVCRLLL